MLEEKEPVAVNASFCNMKITADEGNEQGIEDIVHKL
jgi:hypothetical protein